MIEKSVTAKQVNRMDVLVILCVIMHFATVLTVQVGSREALIHRELFKDYNTFVRPVKNSSMPITVEISLILRRVYDLEEKQNTLHSSTEIEMTWMDDFLSWNATEMGGIQAILVPTKKIWTPNICVKNDVSDKNCFSTHSIVQIESNGKVNWWFIQELKTKCDVDISRYPFDHQKCAIKIGSLYFSDQEVLLKIVDTRTNSTSSSACGFVSNDEWDLLENFNDEIRISCDGMKFTVLNFEFDLKRRVSFHVNNIIIPLFILTCLNLSCYFIPYNAGKLSTSMEVFLAFALFLYSIFDTMPASSRHDFILGMFVTSQLIFSAFTVILNAILSYLFQLNSEIPMSSPFRRLYGILNGARIPKQRTHERHVMENEELNPDEPKGSSIRSRSCRGSGQHPKRASARTISIHSKHSHHSDCPTPQSVDWITFAHSIERMAFAFMLVLNILCYLISVCFLFS